MLKLSWPQVASWRLSRQYLSKRARSAAILDVASRLCGLHAQVMSSAELTLWARLEKLDRNAVQQALWKSRTLVKTWAMRGTLHLLPAAELPMWHAILATSRRYLRPEAWKKYYGITLEQLDQLTQAIGVALDGRVMTREELMAEVQRITGTATASAISTSWGTIFKPAAFTGRLCFAPSVGQRVRFTRPDSWLGSSPAPMDSSEAAAQVTRRFLTAYGPATRRDLARWFGSGMTIVRPWIAGLADEISQVEIEGASAWMLTRDTRSIRESAPARSVALLPAFDQYIIAASPHAENLMPQGLRARIYRSQGWVSPVLLVNGRIAGVWRHELKGSRVDVTIEPFDKVPSWVRKGAEEETERLGEFLGGSVVIRWNNRPR